MQIRGTTSFYRTLTDTTFQDTDISLRAHGRSRTYLTRKIVFSAVSSRNVFIVIHLTVSQRPTALCKGIVWDYLFSFIALWYDNSTLS